jgi:Domain of unknown function (DUF4292)
MKPFLLVTCTLCLAFFLAGCRSKAKLFVSPYEKEELAAQLHAVYTEDELRQSVAERSEALDTLKAKMGVTIRKDGKRAFPSFTALVLYRDPDFIKLAIQRFEIGTLYTLLIKGDEVQMYSRRDHAMFVGTVDDLAEKTGLFGGLTPREVVSALLVQHRLSEVLESDDPYVITLHKNTHFMVTWVDPQDHRQFFWLVRQEDALVEELLIRSPQGREEIRIQYNEYDLVENPETETVMPYPEEMVFRLPRNGMTIKMSSKKYQPDLEFSSAVDSLPEPRDVYLLKNVVFEENP